MQVIQALGVLRVLLLLLVMAFVKVNSTSPVASSASTSATPVANNASVSNTAQVLSPTSSTVPAVGGLVRGSSLAPMALRSEAGSSTSNTSEISLSTTYVTTSSSSSVSISPSPSSVTVTSSQVPDYHCFMEMPNKTNCKSGCCSSGLSAVESKNITLQCTLKNTTKVPVLSGCYVCNIHCGGSKCSAASSIQLGLLVILGSLLFHGVS